MEHQISKAKYEGYMWMSDQTRPEVLDNTTEREFTLVDGENPFVVEGQLWDADNKLSIAIRYVDGKYIISKTCVTDEQMKDSTVEYIAHRINGVESIKFVRIWKEVSDPLCEGMTTLKLQNTAFVGFEKNKGEQK